LLAKVTSIEDVNARAHSAQVFASLFYLYLSGTRATIEQRIKIVETMLRSPDAKERALAIMALKALLEAMHFRTQYDRHDSRLRVIDDSFGIVIRHLFTPLSSRDHPRKKQNSDGENRMGAPGTDRLSPGSG
jgi:phosphatidylglycerophosphatase A